MKGVVERNETTTTTSERGSVHELIVRLSVGCHRENDTDCGNCLGVMFPSNEA